MLCPDSWTAMTRIAISSTAVRAPFRTRLFAFHPGSSYRAPHRLLTGTLPTLNRRDRDTVTTAGRQRSCAVPAPNLDCLSIQRFRPRPKPPRRRVRAFLSILRSQPPCRNAIVETIEPLADRVGHNVWIASGGMRNACPNEIFDIKASFRSCPPVSAVAG